MRGLQYWQRWEQAWGTGQSYYLTTQALSRQNLAKQQQHCWPRIFLESLGCSWSWWPLKGTSGPPRGGLGNSTRREEGCPFSWVCFARAPPLSPHVLTDIRLTDRGGNVCRVQFQHHKAKQGKMDLNLRSNHLIRTTSIVPNLARKRGNRRHCILHGVINMVHV